MITKEPADLADIGLNMAFYGMMTAVASFVIAIVAELIITTTLSSEWSDFRFYSMVVLAWLGFNAKLLFSLIRLSNSETPVENKKNKVRIFESFVIVFMWSYSLFYQYYPFEGNAEPETLNKFFGGIIMILIFYRLLIISIFIRLSKGIDWLVFGLMIVTVAIKVV